MHHKERRFQRLAVVVGIEASDTDNRMWIDVPLHRIVPGDVFRAFEADGRPIVIDGETAWRCTAMLGDERIAGAAARPGFDAPAAA